MCVLSLNLTFFCIIPTKGVYSFFKNINKYVCSLFKFNQKYFFKLKKKVRQPGFEPGCPKYKFAQQTIGLSCCHGCNTAEQIFKIQAS